MSRRRKDEHIAIAKMAKIRKMILVTFVLSIIVFLLYH